MSRAFDGVAADGDCDAEAFPSDGGRALSRLELSEPWESRDDLF